MLEYNVFNITSLKFWKNEKLLNGINLHGLKKVVYEFYVP